MEYVIQAQLNFDVKCKLNTSAITIINNGLLIYFTSTCPFNYCYYDTVTYNSTATLICLSSINDISVSFVYEWIGTDNLVISGLMVY